MDLTNIHIVPKGSREPLTIPEYIDLRVEEGIKIQSRKIISALQEVLDDEKDVSAAKLDFVGKRVVTG